VQYRTAVHRWGSEQYSFGGQGGSGCERAKGCLQPGSCTGAISAVPAREQISSQSRANKPTPKVPQLLAKHVCAVQDVQLGALHSGCLHGNHAPLTKPAARAYTLTAPACSRISPSTHARPLCTSPPTQPPPHLLHWRCLGAPASIQHHCTWPPPVRQQPHRGVQLQGTSWAGIE